ncbi:MAG: hypothetical protein KZQ85_05195 [Candidatus Thiodiazotropha sp. (ex Myrtea sp. 'scaly one' KF741663)]|nr:hypothetical protein [Candidatus Thiodiazotropha sp. (ex Myrtea sp. 'scaly one' KF741663)]
MRLVSIGAIFLVLSGYCLASDYEKAHLDAAMQIYEVAIGDIGEAQAIQYAQILVPADSGPEQKKVADVVLEVMSSDEYKKEYSKIIANIFSEAECNRLAEILKDPILAKFRQNKAVYFQEIMSLAQSMLMSKLEQLEK